MRRRHLKPQRRPIFVGCEGESEQGYAQLLQDLADEAKLPVHLHVEILRKGHALSRIEFARRKVAELQQKRAGFHDKFLMLDSDEFERRPEGQEEARRVAVASGFRVIWQEPCFEALLLRHFGVRRPPNTGAALDALQREWQEYRKGSSRVELKRRIDLEAVLRAARVEDGLAILLRVIGLIEED